MVWVDALLMDAEVTAQRKARQKELGNVYVQEVPAFCLPPLLDLPRMAGIKKGNPLGITLTIFRSFSEP
jgi:hypothetical protein